MVNGVKKTREDHEVKGLIQCVSDLKFLKAPLGDVMQ